MEELIIPIVIGAFGTVTKGLLQELDNSEITGRIVAIQKVFKCGHKSKSRLS